MAKSPSISIKKYDYDGRRSAKKSRVSNRALLAAAGGAGDDVAESPVKDRGPVTYDEVMTCRETAAYLKTTVEQLCRLRRAGKGPPFGQIGHLIRYKRSFLDAWLASRTMTPAD